MARITSIENVEDFACPQDVSVREAMVRITGKVFLFQVVVDNAGKVVGTLTDGDIRRAILRGITPEDPVRSCMNSNPITGRVGEIEENGHKLEQIQLNAGERATFLPVADTTMQLVDILVYETSPAQHPSALIMAGGLGSRLGERTKNTPKPLLPVAGRPILDHIIESLENADVENIFISVRYLADQIEEFVDGRDSKATINILHETEPLGTAGSISLLPESVKGPFITLNGDLITKIDYGAFFAFHERHDFDAIVAVAQHRAEIPFGVVQRDESGVFSGIDEKPSHEYFIAAGINLLTPEFRPLVSSGERIDMPALLNKARNLGLKIGLFPIHEYWVDIGCPDDFTKVSTNFNES